MPLHRVLCPKCRTVLTSRAGVAEGQKLSCPKCKVRFAAAPAAAATDAEVVEDDFEVVDDEPAPAKRPARRPPLDDDDDDRPRSRRRRHDEDDKEEDAPPARRRVRHDDDDEDDRPRRKKAKAKGTYGKLKGNIWVRVITLVVLVTILGVLVYFLIEKRKRDREAEEYNRGRTGEKAAPFDPDRFAVGRNPGVWEA